MRAWLAAAGMGLAAALGAQGDGGQPAAWSRLSLGARAAALGQAVSALADDPVAAQQNPSLLATQTRASLASQGSLLPDGRSADYVGLARPVQRDGDWGWGLNALYYADTTPYEQRNGDYPQPDSTFSGSASLIQGGLGGWIWDRRVALGGAFKLYNQQLDSSNASGLGFDMGLLWRALPWLDLGVAGQDLYGHLNWSTGRGETVPLRERVGAAFHLLGGSLIVTSELVAEADQGPHAMAGLEWWALPGTLAFRAGVQDGQPALGLGGQGRFWDVYTSLDYAVSQEQGYLDQLQQRLSLTLALDL